MTILVENNIHAWRAWNNNAEQWGAALKQKTIRKLKHSGECMGGLLSVS